MNLKRKKIAVIAVMIFVVLGVVGNKTFRAKSSGFATGAHHSVASVRSVKPLEEVVTHGSKGPQVMTSSKKVEMPVKRVTNMQNAMVVKHPKNAVASMTITHPDGVIASMKLAHSL